MVFARRCFVQLIFCYLSSSEYAPGWTQHRLAKHCSVRLAPRRRYRITSPASGLPICRSFNSKPSFGPFSFWLPLWLVSVILQLPSSSSALPTDGVSLVPRHWGSRPKESPASWDDTPCFKPSTHPRKYSVTACLHLSLVDHWIVLGRPPSYTVLRWPVSVKPSSPDRLIC